MNVKKLDLGLEFFLNKNVRINLASVPIPFTGSLKKIERDYIILYDDRGRTSHLRADQIISINTVEDDLNAHR